MPSPSIKPRRSVAIFAVGATIAMAAGVFAVLSLGNDAAKAPGAKLASTASATLPAESPVRATSPVEKVQAAAPGENPSGITPNEEPTAPEETPEVEDEVGAKQVTENLPPKDSVAKPRVRPHKPKQRWERKRPDRSPAEEPEPPPDPDAILKKTLALYDQVGKELIKLEFAKGKKKTEDLRAEYRSISSSRLIHDRSLQPIYTKNLLELRNRIRSRLKQ